MAHARSRSFRSILPSVPRATGGGPGLCPLLTFHFLLFTSHSFTLLELLVTICIAALLLSLSVGGHLLMGRSLAYSASSQLIQGQLLAARNSAVSQHADSFVIIDAAKNTIQTFGQVAVGVWHFDDGSVGEPIVKRGGDYYVEGAFGQKGYLKAGNGDGRDTTLVEGRYGAGIAFPGSADATKLYVECGKEAAYVPIYNAREGVALSAWVYAESESNGNPLNTGDALPIISKIGSSEAPRAPYALFLEFNQTDVSFKAGGLVTLNDDVVKEVLTSTTLVRPRTWTHVAMDYADGGTGLRLYVNGTLRATTTATGQLKLNQQPVRIGMAKDMQRGGGSPVTGAYFSGTIDEVTLAVYEKGPQRTIPEKVSVVMVDPAENDPELGPYKIHFDPRGYLDRQRHQNQPEVLVLSPLTEWHPEAHTLYNDATTLATFRTRYLGTADQLRLLEESNKIHRLRMTWAGTVE